MASSSKDGGAPWIADGSRVGWSGVPILGPRDISPSASRLASEEDPARVENQESLALCWWSTMPVSCSGGDGCVPRCCVLCRDVVCCAEMSRPVCACRDVVSYAEMLCVMPRCLDLCVHAERCGPVSRVSCADMSLFPSTCTCANVSLLKSLFQF